MPDDVALHLRRAGFDGVPARAQITVRPDTLVNGATISGKQLAVRAQQLLRDLLQALIELAPENLQDRSLRPGHARGRDAAESAQLVQAHDFDLAVALREFLAYQRIAGGRPSVPLNRAGELDQPVNTSLE